MLAHNKQVHFSKTVLYPHPRRIMHKEQLERETLEEVRAMLRAYVINIIGCLVFWFAIILAVSMIFR